MRHRDQLRHAIRRRHCALTTEKAYVSWNKQFIRFHDLRHPKHMAETEVEAFLTHLAVDRRVAANTQNQPLCAIQFLYRYVIKRPLGEIQALRASQPKRLPVVLSPGETQRLLDLIHRLHPLMCQILYGCGLRIVECCRLRIKDIDFDRKSIFVRAGKGDKDRIVMLPVCLVEPLRRPATCRSALHQADLRQGFGKVQLPFAMDVKDASASASLEWQFFFLSSKLSRDPRSRKIRRHHIHSRAVAKSR